MFIIPHFLWIQKYLFAYKYWRLYFLSNLNEIVNINFNYDFNFIIISKYIFNKIKDKKAYE